ncbi:uncharacterized protein LOC115759211 [Drosophila novamexicana]|uniref:uncharacterized protein LOC115759211 n=1 Tax=Drosophila novamexicana TaxID=47314 RepID=UPI0011E58A34|nr:uncharacterized protein LOC115759211 [Drosophila novamexicana]
MSYLLTEIALEMLGYKFYDTNGVFHLINFQQSMTAAQTDLQAHPEEPSLMEYIEQQSDPETDKNGHDQPQPPTVPSTISLRGTPVRALAKMMEYESDKLQNGQEQQQKQQQQSNRLNSPAEPESSIVLPKTSNSLRRTPARALTKIMDYENFNIRNQIIRRMEKVLKKEAHIPNEVALQDCLNAELTKIVKDADDMHEFRKFLEERLRRIDSRPYETYMRTFGVE